ncbi:amino acid ABC transporter permease [Mesorhizobium sp. M1A.F.Ca.IN.020.03.2.1]|uniref:amino acid ABC transporter permease n=1 Tax=unclassified Mesorhizobium TaxID=325217 RepID=UPI000FCB0576|nr:MULTISPECIES: amino acid ABC transporter permease [unclassified Mesorhizobium]RUV08354.1 amino acid ABC transporter permease [Mesorhizobium sp. M1A.F.Ca.IN.020.03.2.1]RUV26078.1 amino acid ABC transporter permease [Mesorhizobium sp. M1A.F.Ca.IN.022.04.1.1]RWB32776.1 MAG: amino acid ABC transporter permease [Mesorhizobium sp.]RWD10759.1 MAG: amino acid ABC transporter permease [Mesorhizobium sp.]RWE66989.1 MAG: amino acid ABC transporter permease [Mesorhizobium sp.]
MKFDPSVVLANWDILAYGLLITLKYTFYTCAIGLAIGLLVALLQLTPWQLSRWTGRIWVEFFRNIPLLVLLMWVYYALPIFLQIQIGKETAGILGLGFYASGFYAEILRAGIQSIDRGQTDAAVALGMGYIQRMKRIILPQALRRMVPPLVGQTIMQLKNTTLLSVLTIPDLLYQAGYIASFTYRPMEVYTVIGAIFILILFPLSALSRRFERKEAA